MNSIGKGAKVSYGQKDDLREQQSHGKNLTSLKKPQKTVTTATPWAQQRRKWLYALGATAVGLSYTYYKYYRDAPLADIDNITSKLDTLPNSEIGTTNPNSWAWVADFGTIASAVCGDCTLWG